MTAQQKRSLKRSLIFGLPIVLTALAIPELWQEWGVPPYTAVLVATILAAVSRAAFPDAGSAQEPAEAPMIGADDEWHH